MAYEIFLLTTCCLLELPLNGSFDDLQRFCRATIPQNYAWLRLGHDDNLAVLADWERIRQEGETERFGHRVDDFVELIEARLKVNVPRWWVRKLRKGRLKGGNAWFYWSLEPKMWNRANGYHFSGLDGIAFDQDGACLFQNCESVRIPAGLAHDILVIDENPKDSGYIGQIGGDDLLVGFHGLYSTFGGPGAITCLNKDDLSIKWERELDIGFTGGIGGGNFRGSYSSVVYDGDRVVLFGGNNLAMYFHILARRDGRILCRFCTSYLDRTVHQDGAEDVGAKGKGK